MALPLFTRHLRPRCPFATFTHASSARHKTEPKAKMCTASRLWYKCKCPATSTFRDGVCPRRDPPDCYKKRRNFVLPRVCPFCLRQNERRNATTDLHAPMAATLKVPQTSHTEDKLVDELIDSEAWTWYVPSRCFTDPGFVRLDPFAADRYKRAIEYEAQERRAAYRASKWNPLKRQWQDIKDVLTHRFRCSSIHFPIPLGPCCVRATMAKRLEENLTGEVTRRGPHSDDRCISNF